MISGVFGLPGSGKSLFLGMIADKAIHGQNINSHGLFLGDVKKYNHVFTNFSCSGCFQLDYDKLGINNYHDCLILVDEIMLLSDSRDYKNFSSNLNKFYSEHRKSDCDFIYASQSYDDVDKRIRNRTQQLYYIRSSFFGTSRISRIDYYFDVSFGKINEGYRYAPVLTDYFFFRKKYYNLIDSKEIINFDYDNEPELIPWDSE